MNKEIKERYKKTKFAKGGGSCFECCDYEEMDTEIREFVQKEIEEAIKQERERIIEEIEKRMPSHDAVQEYLSIIKNIK